jgi:hypothetical protein
MHTFAELEEQSPTPTTRMLKYSDSDTLGLKTVPTPMFAKGLTLTPTP